MPEKPNKPGRAGSLTGDSRQEAEGRASFLSNERVQKEIASMFASQRSKRARRAAAAITDEEDAAITMAAEADPDARPVDGMFSRRGRPRLASPKLSILLRLDPDVVARFRAGGDGWQTRMNKALRKAAGLD